MLKISRWECGVLPRRDSDLDGKMGLSPGTGTPLHPDQGIFSCRLHSRLGLSVSHTHSRRSFLSGSSPPPPGPWLPLGRESGAGVRGGPQPPPATRGGTRCQPATCAGVSPWQAGWPLWEEALPPENEARGFIFCPRAGYRRGPARQKRAGLGQSQGHAP